MSKEWRSAAGRVRKEKEDDNKRVGSKIECFCLLPAHADFPFLAFIIRSRYHDGKAFYRQY